MYFGKAAALVGYGFKGSVAQESKGRPLIEIYPR